MMSKIKMAFAGALAGFVALVTATTGASSAPAVAPDCKRVAQSDQRLCMTVRAQSAYAYATRSMLAYVPRGTVLVREITHQGLTKPEMSNALRGQAQEYREHVGSGVSVAVDMRSLRKHYGTDAQYVVGFKDVDGRPGGKKIDRVELDLP